MALKVLMNQKRISEKKDRLSKVREKLEQIKVREANCETALNELNENSTDEERQTVEDEVNDIDTERTEAENEAETLETEIAELERENQELLSKQERTKHNAANPQRRKETNNMNTRKFFGMSYEERDAFFADDAVKDFLKRTRDIMAKRDSVSGSELIIPDTVFSLIKQTVPTYSKLYSRVTVHHVNGTARQPIMGEVPEAIWTEMCGSLNEVTIGFNTVEMDGFKLGAYFAVCNATLEDNDISLATELITALSQAMAKAMDKAINFGKGKDKKMPLGIVTRLLQTMAGSDHSANDRPFKDLSTTNVVTIPASTKDKDLFKAIIEATKNASNDFATGSMTWTMNRKTHIGLVSNSLGINSNAAIVSGIGNQMPAIGGDIVELNMPDDIIVAGYYENYGLAERSGATIKKSEHCKFLDDQTVFAATGRYDGKPTIAEAFVVIGLNGKVPTADMVTFPGDTANQHADE